MNSKSLIWIFVFIGSTLGGLIPNLWGAGFFSVSSIFFSSMGAIVGIWFGYKLSK